MSRTRALALALVVAGLSSWLPSLAIADTTSATTPPDEASATTSPSTSPADAEPEAPLAPVSVIDQAFDLGDGRTLYLECAGDQSPTVVLEVGEGGSREHMDSLFAALAPKYRVCSYDRRNMGRSSAAPIPRSAEDVVADVDDLLREADVPGPYLLVGSSYGAFIVNAYASLHPDRVAAVLMISHPIRTDWFIPEAYPLMTEEEQAADRLWSDGTTNQEHMDSYSMTEAISAAGPLAMPYTVLIPTEPGQCAVAGVCGEIYEVYVTLARRLADESPSGRFRIIDGAHDLYVTHLEDVVDEIDLLAAQLN